MKKNAILLLIIAGIAIIGMAKMMNTEQTGMVSKAQKQPYPGYSLVNTETACNAIHCRVGYAYPVGVDERGHIICQCREDPEWLQYRVTPFRVY
ncbi:hypothetical protein KY314_01360 [Candidatus Woesearchaeota archaeon]|nr:hypothetical protein [Candidatus Woesearchaeota archaeon]